MTDKKTECYWCPSQEVREVDGLWLCLAHDTCSECGDRLKLLFGCRCEQEDARLHETAQWCSREGMDEAHEGPEPDLDAIAEQEEDNAPSSQHTE